MNTFSRRWLLGAVGGLAAARPHSGFAQTDNAPTIETLLGRWQVDLRAGPDAPPYSQWFEVKTVNAEARNFEGRFYNTDIEWARVNRAWGELVLGFVTSDAAGSYHHSAVLRTDAQGEVLDGRSQHTGRNLLVPWRARRAT